jgi:hypothetical protein
VIFFDKPSKSRGNKSKNTQREYIKLKCFCIARKTINRVKMPPTDREKIFASFIYMIRD